MTFQRASIDGRRKRWRWSGRNFWATVCFCLLKAPRPTLVFKANIYSKITSAFVLSVLAVLAIRGGLQAKPLSISHAYTSMQRSQGDLTLNSVFSLIRSENISNLKKITYFSDSKKLQKTLTNIRSKNRITELSEHYFPSSNVVVIIIESFLN